MPQDYLVQRIRDSLFRISHDPDRVTAQPAFEEEDVRSAVRLLARSRVSQILRQLRAVHNLSYADIQANTGLSQQHIYDVEFKDKRLTLHELRLLADCYQVTVEDILGIDLDQPTLPVRQHNPNGEPSA